MLYDIIEYNRGGIVSNIVNLKDLDIEDVGQLGTESDNLTGSKNLIKDYSDSLIDSLSTVNNYDDIDLSTAAGTLQNNIKNVFNDVDITAENIALYYSLMNEANSSGATPSAASSMSLEQQLDSVGGTAVNLPSGLGSVHSYMGWQCITAPSSNQYKLREAAGMNFDSEGFGKIGDRYVVATTTTFGNVGDYIDVVQEDGSVIKCIIGDIKSQGDPGCNQWGHNNGQCVVEFVVDKASWYGGHANPGTSSCHPEWNQNITQIINKGNYFDTDQSLLSAPSSSSAPSMPVANNTVTYSVGNNSQPSYSSGSSGNSVVYSSNSWSTGAGAAVVGVTAPVVVGGGSSGGSPTVSTTPVTTTSGDPNIDISKYHNNLDAGFEVTAGNTAYELSDSDVDLLCAIVSAESDGTYDDALAVITTILNRCESQAWINSHGTDPVRQATAPNQFVVYQEGLYKKFTNGNSSDIVKEAVKDALAGVRNHKYLSFRSNGSTGYSSNMISPTGNRYK